MEANLFIKNYKAEGNKIKDLQFYGDMEIDVGSGSGGGGTVDKKYIYATGETLHDEIDSFITPIKIDFTYYLMIQIPTDSFLVVAKNNGETNTFAAQSTKNIFLPGGTTYSVKISLVWYGTNILLFSSSSMYKSYILSTTYIESLFQGL